MSDYEFPWQNPANQPMLNHLADNGLVLVRSYPSLSINFGVKLDGAEGPFPYVCPTGDDGMHIDIAAQNDEALVKLQQQSVVDAYLLGRKEGIASVHRDPCPLTVEQLDALCDALLVCDHPGDLAPEKHNELSVLADEAASFMGYSCWIDFYPRGDRP